MEISIEILNKKLCRVCLKDPNKLQSLYIEKNSSVLEKLRSFIQIEVFRPKNFQNPFLIISNLQNDEITELPKWICTPCISLLKNSFDFKEMCYKNDQRLREALKKSKDQIIKTEDEEMPIAEFLHTKIEEIDIKLEISKPNISDDEEDEQSGNDNTNDLQSSSDEDEVLSKIKDRIQKPSDESDLDDSNDELEETLKCDKCDSEFKSNAHFKKHQVAKHGELYDCLKCDEKFKLRNDLLIHQSKIHNIEKYRCKICSRRYRYRVSLNRHIKKYHKELCSSNETDVEEVEIKEEPKLFKCKICDSAFSTEILLQTHDVSEHNGVYECKLCDKRFTGRQYIARHNTIVHGDEMYQCSVCNKKYKYKKFLKRHMEKNHGSNPENQFQCSVCPKQFSTLARFNFHTRNHFLPKIHQCDICSKMFKTETNLRTHKTSHLTFEERSTAKSIKKYLCPICGKILFSPSGRDVHIRTHNEEKQFKCNICSWAFKEKSQLETHMSKHSEERPFKCEICGFCVKNSQQFNSHKMTHKLKTMDKQFECTICGVKMRYKISLSHHMRNVHLGIRNHKCDECDQAFYTSNLLKQHKAKKHCIDF